MNRALCCFLLVVVAALGGRAATPTNVGIEGQLEVSLPFSDLKARPPDRAAPVVVRIASSQPEQGATGYDLRYMGLVPGRYDLRAYLIRPDGSAPAGLPPMEIEIRGLLPPDQHGTLIPIPKERLSMFGGYRWAMAGIGALWLLAAIPLFRRKRSAPIPQPATPARPLSLAERLRPLVERAAAGQLSIAEKAELERMVLGHWRERLALGDLSPAEAITRLRAHPEARVLLGALEDWLHRPPGSAAVDLDPLLAAYAPATVEESKEVTTA